LILVHSLVLRLEIRMWPSVSMSIAFYVREIEPASGVNNEVLLIPNIEIVPRAPLEDEVAIRHELLDDLFRH